MSQRATGLPWNSTFADAAEKVRDVASGQSQVAITGLVTLLGPAMMALSEGEQQGGSPALRRARPRSPRASCCRRRCSACCSAGADSELGPHARLRRRWLSDPP